MSDKVAKKESKRGICVHRRRQLAKVGSYRKLCVAELFRIFFRWRCW